eukprot:gene30618-35629_t
MISTTMQGFPTARFQILVWASTLLSVGLCLDNGVGKMPAMGWNSWNKFRCAINDSIIREAADAIVSSGLKDAGFQYINLDDCWMEKRGPDNKIIPFKDRFPDMKALADYVHSKGLKFGLYSDAGNHTCEGYPGSWGYEELDAQTYADWGFVLLGKWPATSLGTEGGFNDPDMLVVGLDGMYPYEHVVGCKAGEYISRERWGKVGGLTFIEQRTHFTFWVMLSAPLILGNDPRDMSKATLSILKAKEVIAISQDDMALQGTKGTKVNSDIKGQIWIKKLSKERWAVMLFNFNSHWTDITLNFTRDLPTVHQQWARDVPDTSPDCVDKSDACKGWADNGECVTNSGYMLSTCLRSCPLGCPHAIDPPGPKATALVRDAWMEEDLGPAVGKFVADHVDPHDCRLLVLTFVEPEEAKSCRLLVLTFVEPEETNVAAKKLGQQAAASTVVGGGSVAAGADVLQAMADIRSPARPTKKIGAGSGAPGADVQQAMADIHSPARPTKKIGAGSGAPGADVLQAMADIPRELRDLAKAPKASGEQGGVDAANMQKVLDLTEKMRSKIEESLVKAAEKVLDLTQKMRSKIEESLVKAAEVNRKAEVAESMLSKLIKEASDIPERKHAKLGTEDLPPPPTLFSSWEGQLLLLPPPRRQGLGLSGVIGRDVQPNVRVRPVCWGLQIVVLIVKPL